MASDTSSSNCFQQSHEPTKRVELGRGSAVGIEMHYVVPNVLNFVQMVDEGGPVDFESKSLPSLGVFEKTDMFTKAEISKISDLTIGVSGILD